MTKPKTKTKTKKAYKTYLPSIWLPSTNPPVAYPVYSRTWIAGDELHRERVSISKRMMKSRFLWKRWTSWMSYKFHYTATLPPQNRLRIRYVQSIPAIT